MRALTVGLPGRDDGATAAEYAVILALIVAAVITAIRSVGDASTGIWANDAGKIQNAIQGR